MNGLKIKESDMSIEAMKLVRDALAQGIDLNLIGAKHILDAAIEQAQRQEPVAWMHPTSRDCVSTQPHSYKDAIPLYTSPPQRRKLPTQDLNAPLTVNGVPMYPRREWQGLTDEEPMQMWEGIVKYAPSEVRINDFARAIEAKLKEKNT
jgi:hypothetical protein